MKARLFMATLLAAGSACAGRRNDTSAESFGWQYDGTPASFRNLRVKPLASGGAR